MRWQLAAAALALAPLASANAETASPAATIRNVDTLYTTSVFPGTIAISSPQVTHQWNGKTALPANSNIKLWRWASVTKQIMAVLVMQEVAAGRISLEAPLNRYLSGFKSPNAASITVRQLLRHQSGLPNPNDTAAVDDFPSYYLPDYTGSRSPLDGYCAGPVNGEPGGDWTYNNCDYIVAGALLEAVTGKSWRSLVRDRISKPLGLKTLGAFPTRRKTAIGTSKQAIEPRIDLASYDASAALFGSPADLLAFDRALMAGKLLPQAQLAELWDGQPRLGYMALGQWVFDAKLKDCATPVRLVERRGAIGGVQVRNFMIPERQTAIVAFSDKAEGDFEFGEIWQGSGFSHDLLNAALCEPAAAGG